MTAGYIWDMVADGLRFTATSDRARIKQPSTMALWDLCELAPWPLLRMSRSVTFSGSAVSLGSDVIGAFAVVGSDNQPYWQVEQSEVGVTSGRKRWYRAATAYGGSLPTTGPSIQIVDSTGAAELATVTVHYWVYPPALSSDSDLILIPASRALVIKTIQYMFAVVDHDPAVADRLSAEYEVAKAELLSKYQPPARFAGGAR